MTSLAIRQALVPMLTGYLLIMTALGFGLRRLCRPKAGDLPERSLPAERPGGPGGPGGPGAAAGSRRGWLALARRVTGTAVGGYLVLMAVVIAYYYGVARVGRGFLKDAFTGNAMLIGLALPLFWAASWLTERYRRRLPRRRSRRGTGPGNQAG